MGIERFFNSIKSKYNIVKDLKYPYKKIKTKYLFFDFNSIIHNISQKIISDINKLIENILIKKDIKNFNEYINLYNLDFEYNDFKNQKKSDILKYFNEYFTIEKLNKIIIDKVKDNILFLLNNNFEFDELKLIYIGIDGVPSKSKMIEQKKRRYMGEFSSLFKKKLIKKNKNKISYEKWYFQINKIEWSKTHISPGTKFMKDMVSELSSKKFKSKIYENIKNKINIIISGITEFGEAEKKIVDYINLNKDINKDITVYSPDADMILLCMLLKNIKNLKILRLDQQLTEKDEDKEIFHNIYNLIDVDDLKDAIFKYINLKLNKEKVLNDIILIFTFFGDDFLPKIESYNVRTDIDYIFDAYKKVLKNFKDEDKYLIKEYNNIYKINEKNFKYFINILSKEENNILKRNYLSKNYENYSKLYNSLKEYYKEINIELTNNNLIDLIKKYNFSRDCDELKFLIKKYIDKLNNNKNIKEFLNLLKKFIKNFKETNISFNNFFESIKKYIVIKDLYNVLYISNKDYIRQKSIKEMQIIKKKKLNYYEYISNESLLEDISTYILITNNFPKIKKYLKYSKKLRYIYVTANNVKYIGLKEYSKSINDNFHKNKTKDLNNLEKEIYKFEKMLDEYRYKLNKVSDINLGTFNEKNINRSIRRYNNTYFKEKKINNVVEDYLIGIIWILNYYYNDKIDKTWFYINLKAPLIRDINEYLTNNNNIFDKLKKKLNYNNEKFFTPIEQMMYIMPFDANKIKKTNEDKNLLIFKNLLSIEQIEKVKEFIKDTLNDSKLKNFYFSLDEQAKTILEKKNNKYIDCKDAFYLNKCNINELNSNKSLDYLYIIKKFRKYLSFEEQYEKISDNKKFNISRNGKYKKYKKIYFKTGNYEFKKLYKKYKNYKN
jgi:5'-3' exonuclease